MVPIDLQLEFMEGNAISFQSLLQTWVKESFTKTYASSSGGVQGRLSFDLPETMDGIMCSISLDLQYTILPDSIHSPSTKGLVEDMRQISMLSPSSIEVAQTIPLSSVDSSLIYGVPMSAWAGLENDISRYDEMKMLARQLWTYLSRSDVGLVLRVRTNNSEGNSNDGGGFAAPRSLAEEQLFLLVCEEAVQKPQPQALDHESNPFDPSEALKAVPDKARQGKAPCHGILYRYATKSQILRFGIEEKRLAVQGEENMTTEVSDHYLDYIERSLDTLVKTGLNPLLLGGNSTTES